MQQRYAAHPQASPYGTTFTPGHSERLPAPVRPTSVKTVTPVDQPLVTLQLSLAHARASACLFLWFEKHVSMQVPRGVPWGKLQRHHNNPRVWTCPHCGQAFGTNYRHYYKYHYQGRCGSSQCDQGASVPVDEANPSAVPSAVPAGTPVEPGPFGTEDYAAAELQQQFVELGLDANQQLHTLERLVEARRAAEAAAAERLQQQEQLLQQLQLVQQQLQEQLADEQHRHEEQLQQLCQSYEQQLLQQQQQAVELGDGNLRQPQQQEQQEHWRVQKQMYLEQRQLLEHLLQQQEQQQQGVQAVHDDEMPDLLPAGEAPPAGQQHPPRPQTAPNPLPDWHARAAVLQAEQYKELREAPLFPGCRLSCALEAYLLLFNWRCRNAIKDRAFDELLQLQARMLPEGHRLVASLYLMRKVRASWCEAASYECGNFCRSFQPGTAIITNLNSLLQMQACLHPTHHWCPCMHQPNRS